LRALGYLPYPFTHVYVEEDLNNRRVTRRRYLAYP